MFFVVGDEYFVLDNSLTPQAYNEPFPHYPSKRNLAFKMNWSFLPMHDSVMLANDQEKTSK